jgi:hypothetical protein
VSRHASSRLPSARRRVTIRASVSVAVLAIGWVAVGGIRAGAHGHGDATARSEPSPGSPRPAASRSSSAATPTASRKAAPNASSSAGTATQGTDDAGEIPISVDNGTSAALSVTALDLTDGRRAGYGTTSGTTFDTASIVKVDILAALLLQAQDSGRELTAEEKTRATAMIEASDNNATDKLWVSLGSGPAFEKANRRLGLRHTTAGPGILWGLTRTTAADQIAVLSAVFGDPGSSPLTSASRAYIRDLMAHVEKDQRWGVSAGGTVTGLKNGWLPRTATGLWDINSIGLVTAGGHQVLLATLSSGNKDMASGITLVEKAARAAVASLGLAAS